jgi:glycerol kinase
MTYILALDQGTTSSRAILFDATGSAVATSQQEITQHYPQPGWVEHDPMEIWTTQIACARDVLRKSGVAPGQVRAIGITNQRETTLLWDRATGEPVGRAIVWQDRRTALDCDALRAEGRASLIAQKTGLVIDAYFSGTKLAWLLNHLPRARERAARGELAFGTVDTWLTWQLTGGKVHATDASNASRTMLFNIHTKQWDDELLAMLDIPASLLPRVVPTSGVLAHAKEELFGAAIPVASICGDQQAASFGQACLKPGMAKNTFGTGCFILLNTGSAPIASQHQLIATIGWQLGAQTDYMLEGSIFMGGATVQWLRDGLGVIRNSADVEELASRVDSTDGVLLVPAFVGLGAPYWDPDARGTIVGMTRGTSAAHVARAALESIAFQSADVLDAMQRDSGLALSELRVDGGAARNNLLMQFQSDILGVPVLRPAVTETTALGAAYLAGLAVGVWDSKEALASHWHVERRFEPRMSQDEREQRMADWRRAVERSRHWAVRDTA